MLTSLFRQPSIITCCYLFDKNCGKIDNTEPPISTEQSLEKIPRWLTLQSYAEVDLHNVSLLPTLQCAGIRTKVDHRYQNLSAISKLGGGKHTTAFHKSSETNRHQTLKHLRQYSCYGNELDSTLN